MVVSFISGGILAKFIIQMYRVHLTTDKNQTPAFSGGRAKALIDVNLTTIVQDKNKT
jgi:hypothetical protein